MEEPHILSRWYAMRNGAWWRGVRWIVPATLLLPVLLCMQAVLFGLYIYYVRGWQAGVQRSSSAIVNLFVAFNRDLGPVLIVVGDLTLAVALAMAGWQLRNATVPDDLAVTQSPQELRSYRAVFARRVIWLWVGLLCLPPHIISFVSAVGLNLAGRSGWGSWNYTAVDWLMLVLAYTLLAELAIRLALSADITPLSLVLLPLVLYMLLRGTLALAWSTLSDMEQMDTLTEPQADGLRMLLSLVLALLFAFLASRLRVRTARDIAGATIHPPR